MTFKINKSNPVYRKIKAHQKVILARAESYGIDEETLKTAWEKGLFSIETLVRSKGGEKAINELQALWDEADQILLQCSTMQDLIEDLKEMSTKALNQLLAFHSRRLDEDFVENFVDYIKNRKVSDDPDLETSRIYCGAVSFELTRRDIRDGHQERPPAEVEAPYHYMTEEELNYRSADEDNPTRDSKNPIRMYELAVGARIEIEDEIYEIEEACRNGLVMDQEIIDHIKELEHQFLVIEKDIKGYKQELAQVN